MITALHMTVCVKSLLLRRTPMNRRLSVLRRICKARSLDMDAALLCRLLFDFARHEGAADSPLKTSHTRAAWCVLSAIFGGERWDYSRPRIRGNVAEGAAGSVGEGKERQGSRQTRNRYWQALNTVRTSQSLSATSNGWQIHLLQKLVQERRTSKPSSRRV